MQITNTNTNTKINTNMETNLDRSGAAWDVVDMDLATMVELDCLLRPEQIFPLNLIARYDYI